MTFGEKLKRCRTDKGLTQDELAEILYVSRTAVSKWESGRGFPNIESLKAISKYFAVTVDDLLSGDELITLAQEEQKQKENHIKDMIFGLLDCSMALMLFLPFFAQNIGSSIQDVSLVALAGVRTYLKVLYFVIVIGSILLGISTLVMQNCTNRLWAQSKTNISLLLGAIGVTLFIISRQPYAAVFVFVFLIIKVLVLIKQK